MTALERVKESLAKHQAGRNQLARVQAGDVVALVDSVPSELADEVTAALAKGAKAVRSDSTIYQLVDDLLHVVALVEGVEE